MSITKKIRPDGSAYYLLVESAGYDLDEKVVRAFRGGSTGKATRKPNRRA